MALFRKNTSNTTIPELQEYYATQRRESTGLAWLLAIGSLLVTAAVIVGLFVGGRWAYRKINNKNKSTSSTTVTTSTNTGTTSTTTTTPSTSGSTTPTTSSSSTTGSTGGTTTTSTTAPGVATTQSTTTNTTATPATTTTPSTPAVTEVPNTGAGNTIGLFIVITAGTYLANRARLLRKTRA